MAEWYCQVDGRERGPYSSEQLRGLVAAGQLAPDHLVRKLPQADWLPASRVRGLFEATPPAPSSVPGGAGAAAANGDASEPAHGYAHVRRVAQCVSKEERSKRLGTAFLSVLMWLVGVLFVLGTFGAGLVFYLLGWVANRLLAEYNVRKLQAVGTEATVGSFPEVVRELKACCEQFGVAEVPKVIVINDASVNAFAIRFAKKRVIVLLSETLEGMLDRPAQLRFILGHELGHHLLDFGSRRFLEVYKSASFRAARELTCDNVGTATAGGADPAVSVLKRLGVGHALHTRLDDAELAAEARYLESGLTGWLLKQYLTYPPLGRRIGNVKQFARTVGEGPGAAG
jgi:Zn-dependent protease with chaperone function